MYFILLLVPLFFISCAGPTNPFGADVFISENFKISEESTHNNIDMKLFPDRQYYNSPYDMELQITDPDLDITQFRYEIIYNHKKLNRWFKSEEIIFPKNPNGPIKIKFKNLSILPGNINKITFLYYPKGSENPLVHHLEIPECFTSEKVQNIDVTPFEVKNDLLDQIEKISGNYEYNQSLVAALIAQESSFRPKTISKAWALGLTQVTPLAHKEITKVKTDWPIYPQFESLSLRTIRTLLEVNKINAKNDWRLDPKKSIEGGLIYLDYIKNYWSTPDKKQILLSTFKNEVPRLDIYLASYNSGAYRVKKSLLENGKDWLFDNELNEARKYIMNIKSYCYAFKEGKHHEK